MILLQLLVDGLQLGALYALMAVGFAIIFGSTRVFHYAHGTTYILVGYLFYWLSDRIGVPWWLAAVVAAAAAVVFGVAIDRFVYRPIQRDEGSFFTVFVASFGVGVVAENLVVIFFGASYVSISTPLTRVHDIGGGGMALEADVIAPRDATVVVSLAIPGDRPLVVGHRGAVGPQ